MANREVLMDNALTGTDQVDPEIHDLPPLSDEQYQSDDEFELGGSWDLPTPVPYQS